LFAYRRSAAAREKQFRFNTGSIPAAIGSAHPCREWHLISQPARLHGVKFGCEYLRIAAATKTKMPGAKAGHDVLNI